MLSLRIVITVALSAVWALSAQSSPPVEPPASVKRVPPAAQGGTRPKDIQPLLQQYDFGSQIRTLEAPDNLPVVAKPEGTKPGASNGPVPKDFRPKSDVPLSRQRTKPCA